ncbi:MAG: Lrp/AsnC family transcriptional regulator [Pseudomonadales bacterium]|nr:Lrp/AsnC family transcriptional regulator [Pseudomonadales bacterium]
MLQSKGDILHSLSDLDRQILMHLQSDGRISNQELSERVGTSTASCWRRVKTLEQAGIIDSYTALLNRENLGLGLCVFVHVTLSRHNKKNTQAFEKSIQHRAEIMECFATTGDADFILRVVTKSISSFDQFLEDFLFELPEISQIRSNIALRELKFDTALPLD